ncbi:MAG: hypothetical protein LBL67_03600 [Coriobacteriales bacterium]|jgi:hypothetical protein|nr:hypothetical protein [Coriobacteriales bacterium]
MPDLEDEIYKLRQAEERKYAEGLAQLPKINLGALFMPGVWGPAHGQWLTILFYPLWLVADSCLCNAVTYRGVAIPLGVCVAVGTALLMVFYAKTIGPKAYLRVAERVPIDKYLRRERSWAWLSLAIAVILLALATAYNLVFRLALL